MLRHIDFFDSFKLFEKIEIDKGYFQKLRNTLDDLFMNWIDIYNLKSNLSITDTQHPDYLGHSIDVSFWAYAIKLSVSNSFIGSSILQDVFPAGFEGAVLRGEYSFQRKGLSIEGSLKFGLIPRWTYQISVPTQISEVNQNKIIKLIRLIAAEENIIIETIGFQERKGKTKNKKTGDIKVYKDFRLDFFTRSNWTYKTDDNIKECLEKLLSLGFHGKVEPNTWTTNWMYRMISKNIRNNNKIVPDLKRTDWKNLDYYSTTNIGVSEITLTRLKLIIENITTKINKYLDELRKYFPDVKEFVPNSSINDYKFQNKQITITLHGSQYLGVFSKKDGKIVRMPSYFLRRLGETLEWGLIMEVCIKENFIPTEVVVSQDKINRTT